MLEAISVHLGAAQVFVADTLATIEATILRLAETAASRGVDLLAFPEMGLTGYNPAALGRPGFPEECDAAIFKRPGII